jgi:hypothetical protein
MLLVVVGFMTLPIGFTLADELLGKALIAGAITAIGVAFYADYRLKIVAGRERLKVIELRAPEIIGLIDCGGEWPIRLGSGALSTLGLCLVTVVGWIFATVTSNMFILAFALVMTLATAVIVLMLLPRWGNPIFALRLHSIELPGFGPIEWKSIQFVTVIDYGEGFRRTRQLEASVPSIARLVPQMQWPTRILFRISPWIRKGKVVLLLNGSSEDPLLIKRVVDHYWKQSGGARRLVDAMMPEQAKTLNRLEELMEKVKNADNPDTKR